jgi:hypothetical protein
MQADLREEVVLRSAEIYPEFAGEKLREPAE